MYWNNYSMIWEIDFNNTEEEKNKFSIFIYKEKTKMAKLKKIIKEEIENFGHDIDSINIRDSGLEPILEYKNVIIKFFMNLLKN